ncbi:hypothetical protein ACFL6S_36875, partial [Candidatus Poribacteria bacterium]
MQRKQKSTRFLHPRGGVLLVFQCLVVIAAIAVTSTSVVAIPNFLAKCKFAVAVYQSNGDLAPAFDYDGKIATGFPPNSSVKATAVAIDASGKIVVAGTTGG